MITKHSSEITKKYLKDKIQRNKERWDDAFRRYYICHRLSKGKRYGFLWLRKAPEDESEMHFRQRCPTEIWEDVNREFYDNLNNYNKMLVRCKQEEVYLNDEEYNLIYEQ